MCASYCASWLAHGDRSPCAASRQPLRALSILERERRTSSSFSQSLLVVCSLVRRLSLRRVPFLLSALLCFSFGFCFCVCSVASASVSACAFVSALFWSLLRSSLLSPLASVSASSTPLTRRLRLQQEYFNITSHLFKNLYQI